ncbi:phosphotransferase family protein [Inquilinus limosus]|uniref:Aminoglycoside resistance protein n=1 Tax=Inquilinus limosus TaxID=171674 RepID=A0A211ZHB0_9PROT|nr:aminoglycoside phosphotransferase family protein [Inquilinus limosus]OWJ64662.1 aminoglycoside resistance protein [Inquilinus limosus]
MAAADLDACRAAILRAFPDLAASEFRILAESWDSTAVEADGGLVFKFPRHEPAAQRLRKEAALLGLVRPAAALPVPDLELVEGPPLFSRHAKIPGEHLLAEHYAGLPGAARRRLAEDLARFHAGLHRLDPGRMAAAGAGPVEEWGGADRIGGKALPALPPALRPAAERLLDAYGRLPPEPHPPVYGFFDGHGWNMAFDHGRQRLNGIYDFADSGIGPLHQEFVYSGFVSPDLSARLATAYEALTGLALDRRRIAILTGTHRLWELAELADDPEHLPMMVRSVVDWVAAAEPV